MGREEIVQSLAAGYYRTRPNLGVAHRPLCVFFVSCAGSGKSTVTRQIVNELQATYVCNDEVRVLLSDATLSHAIEIKEIIGPVWRKILDEAPNKFVVFDCAVVQYHMFADSYMNQARRLGVRSFVVFIDQELKTLQKRVITRGVNVQEILENLPAQYTACQEARRELALDWTLAGDFTEGSVSDLAAHLRSIVG